MTELIYKGKEEKELILPPLGRIKHGSQVTVYGKKHIEYLKNLGFEEVKKTKKKKEEDK
ncbi:hypothetical protein ANDROMEDA_21 [Bacillus phage Andromeda]|uniref:Uncharacterized protein n=5 Tax=Andromedavirus TaxID=1623275 RepID=M1IF41_9CAUD|nr:hypothetical protein I905_gp21 [Bacillus phage Andromeda]YP_007517565.1 hypothetical protein I906_gp21 [Bacillus phage Curly]YP_008770657.1 hypothetical protein Glittering_21 [Bacillus phage Glittering]AGE60860.1 hypothetical protein GEMINI_21 [Bacillus phage Gemini]QMS41891.1 hypothetical protein Bolokhovo_21 [Bacillus phage Bolokhovo]AGE60708.1 hypothetical protein CURLY_21 [Bacillus phage Curly]AGE61091.1 hypothetical protein ANDROMEDA_21 [Bacillus phage Andromeda]AGY47208.1 hypothetic